MLQVTAKAVSDDEYWAGIMDEDSIESFANLANWQGFLPPPPRPSFLDELASSDSLTTCDMCTWAYQDGANSLGVTQGEGHGQRTILKTLQYCVDRHEICCGVCFPRAFITPVTL